MAMPGWFTFGQNNAGTMQVNSQLIPVPMSNAFYPSYASAPFYKGSGQPPPTIPLNYMSRNGTDYTSQMAANNPFSFTQSPLIIAVAALVIGLLGLRYVHWRG